MDNKNKNSFSHFTLRSFTENCWLVFPISSLEHFSNLMTFLLWFMKFSTIRPFRPRSSFYRPEKSNEMKSWWIPGNWINGSLWSSWKVSGRFLNRVGDGWSRLNFYFSICFDLFSYYSNISLFYLFKNIVVLLSICFQIKNTVKFGENLLSEFFS